MLVTACLVVFCVVVPEGSCQRADNTGSGIIGWWNSSSPSWTDISQCSLAEVPGGIQKASFYHPRNNSQPDEVTLYSDEVTLYSIHSRIR